MAERGKLAIRMLHDRLLVSLDDEATGAHVRAVEVGDRVLFDPEERAEVEVRGESFVLLRERDLHAVASERIEEGQTGLYL